MAFPCNIHNFARPESEMKNDGAALKRPMPKGDARRRLIFPPKRVDGVSIRRVDGYAAEAQFEGLSWQADYRLQRVGGWLWGIE